MQKAPSASGSSDFTRSSLSATGIVDYSLNAGVSVSDDLRLRMIAHLQAKFDYDELAGVFVSKKRSDLLFRLISQDGLLRRRNQDKLAIGTFKASVRAN